MRTITVPVRQIVRATPRTRLLNLDLTNVEFAFAAGQAVMIGLHGSALRKPYSIASAAWEVQKTGVMQVLVQVEDSGGLDPHLELAAPGTLLDVEGPFGTFAVPNESTAMLLVAGGTGIAPLRSILMERLLRGSAVPISLIYSGRAPEEFAFRSDFEAMAAAGRLKLFLTMTREGEWVGRRGRIDRRLIEEALPSTTAHCFVCGPPQMVNDVTTHLRDLGVDDARIQIEKY